MTRARLNMKNSRTLAAQALLKQEARAAWSSFALDAALEEANLPPREAAFAAALFYGVLERRITLDACIAPYLKTPADKLDAAVRCALRLGVYQLLYMDSVPAHAAVGESVELVKRLRKTQAAGLVNGVLRAFLRAGKPVPLPGGPPDARLSVEYACPRELAALWLGAYGEARTRAFLAQSLGRPAVAVRVNTLKTTDAGLISLLDAEGVQSRPHTGLPHCLLLETGGAPQKLEAFRQGLFHVQDAASQFCALATGARPGMRVLDACAAPGGKSFTIAQMLQNTGAVIACDLHEKRAGLIGRGAARLGITCLSAAARDMTKPHPELAAGGPYDIVLCDVPCSGYGSMRHKPEIKYKPLAEFENITNVQYNILESSSHYCKAGGTVLYSTCTLNPSENDAVAARFLSEHPEFAPRSLCFLGDSLSGGAHTRTLMGDCDADGFFLASFTRREAL